MQFNIKVSRSVLSNINIYSLRKEYVKKKVKESKYS
jgi:hypothetical protein